MLSYGMRACIRYLKIIKPQMLIKYDCKIPDSAFLLGTRFSRISSNDSL